MASTDGELELYRVLLDDHRTAVRQVLLGLSADGLNWRTLPGETSSIYNLAQYCAWIESWLIGWRAGGRPFPYDWSENQDLRSAGEDAADLLFWLDEAAAASEQVLTRLTGAMLDAPDEPASGQDAKPRTRRWAIVHAIEHYAEHIGQMRLTRQLWEARDR